MLPTKMSKQKFNKVNEEQEDHSNKIAALRKRSEEYIRN